MKNLLIISVTDEKPSLQSERNDVEREGYIL
jgi:hypothetical protein